MAESGPRRGYVGEKSTKCKLNWEKYSLDRPSPLVKEHVNINAAAWLLKLHLACVPGHFDITRSGNGPVSDRSINLHRSFPVSDTRASVGD